MTNITCKSIFSQTKLPNLKHFYLDFCPKVDVEFLLASLPKFSPGLKSVSLYGTMDTSHVDRLKNALPTLRSIVVMEKGSGNILIFSKKFQNHPALVKSADVMSLSVRL